MSLRDIFNYNPFQNLIVADRSTADLPLRGHEDLLERRFSEIRDAIENPDYPSNAQHTIVFGEWGHGKTHVLRTLENKINSEFPSKAKAVFYEPSESDPQAIFLELCGILNITASNPAEFIDAIKEKYPENLFLLIDETQAVVGEKISMDMKDHLQQYWTLLSDLQEVASDKLFALHIFHGLSLNSADAIKRVEKIPAIMELKRYIFSLKSLDEESQWKMFCDHMNKASKDGTVNPKDWISPGVSRCINELTGGNPRFALSLMGRIFNSAERQNLDRIDGSICYQTLCDTPRLDASGQNYFTRFLINDLFDQLSEGQQFEQNIADMLKQNIGLLLGEWTGIDQETLGRYNLTTATIRRRCNSLSEPLVLFDQPQGQADFRLSNDFIRLIQVKRQKTLTEVEDKDELLRLTLEPETLLPRMMTGIMQIMRHNGYPGQFRELPTEIPLRLYVTNLGGGAHLAQNIKVGFSVYKGKEIPREVFSLLLEEIEMGQCTVIVIIEDAYIRHDHSGSNYQRFKEAYDGEIDIEKRLLFINETDSTGQGFDEDFFVQLIRTSIQEAQAREWFDRLQISQQFKRVEEDCIYCPDLNEQALIEELLRQDRSFKVGEIRSLDDSFSWVNRERLAKLELYLIKSGTTHTARKIDQIGPLRFILDRLQGHKEGFSKKEIEQQITAKYIRTGLPAAITDFVQWELRLLVEQSKAKEENGHYFFKDLDRELIQLKEDYSKLLQSANERLSEYKTAQIEVPALDDIRGQINTIDQRISVGMIEHRIEAEILELRDAIGKLKELNDSLRNIPDQVRSILKRQFGEIKKLFESIKQSTSWPYKDMENPYETLYRLGEIEKLLEKTALGIAEEIPQQKRCRQEIRAINKRLEGLEKLLKGQIISGSFERDEVVGCIFKLFNAIKDEKLGKVTLYIEG